VVREILIGHVVRMDHSLINHIDRSVNALCFLVELLVMAMALERIFCGASGGANAFPLPAEPLYLETFDAR